MDRVIFYVDGFNFYYGKKSKGWKKYYWLNIVEFFKSFLREDQKLVEVDYFSAVPCGDKGKAKRQNSFFSANRALNSDFNLYLGKYLPKENTCPKCNTKIRSFEEKQTDVHISTKMIRDVVLDRTDISILVSADSDLCPPIDLINELKPEHKIFVYFPPHRFSYDLENKSSHSLKLERYEKRFKDHLMPEEVKLLSDYIVRRPDSWK